MARKTERWTTRSYITTKSSGSEDTRLMIERVYELQRQPDGSWTATLIETHRSIPQEEQDEIMRECIKDTGRILSDHISNEESLLASGIYKITDLLQA